MLENEHPGPLEDFHGFRPLPAQWTVDWDFFFESEDPSNMQMARKIDSHLSFGTFHLPGETGVMKDLAFRNLRRGKALGLPENAPTTSSKGGLFPRCSRSPSATGIANHAWLARDGRSGR